MSELITPSKAVNWLKSKGFLARQNKIKKQPLWINLGGPGSELRENKIEFKGLILLKPLQNMVFGACRDEIRKLHEKVMKKGVLKDKRKEGIKGPKNEPHRVEVTLNEIGEAFCTNHKIEGLFYNLQFNNGYNLIDIQIFIERLAEYCK